jgi:L-aminopeptidase/D-esterase-like protein
MPAGSVIAIIATDAPLLPHQLKRLARRVPLGLARTGAVGHNGSGDIFLALSTANETAFASGDEPRSIAFLPNAAFNPLFEAAVQVVEEAVLDAMIPNQAMTGANDLTVRALPHGELIDLLRRYGRM